MDPLQPQIIPTNPETPVLAANTPPIPEVAPVATEEDTPVRILDIIRAAPPQTAAVNAVAAPYPTPTIPATPVTASRPTEHIPSLAELGGSVSGVQGQTISTIDDIGELNTAPVAPLQPKHEMEVYAPDLPKDKPLPPMREDINATNDSPLAGIAMDKIKLEAPEARSPMTFSTSLTPEHIEEPAPAPAAGSKVSSDFIIPSVHTLRDDMKTVVQDQSMSIVRASALEQEKRHARSEAIEQSGNKEKPNRARSGNGIIIAIIVFFVLGGTLGGGFLWYRANQQSPLAGQATLQSLIFAEQSSQFSLSNSSPSVLKTSLGSFRTTGAGSPGSITRVIPTVSTDTSIGGTSSTHIATPQEFFTAIGAQAPDELATALGSDLFIGIHATDGNQAVIIIPITSYEHAFAGMLAWEPNMGDGLAPFLERAPATLTAADGSSVVNAFKDIVIKNYDVRMQSDASGNPKILYTFPNRNLLIITSSPYTLTEALARLQAARKL